MQKANQKRREIAERMAALLRQHPQARAIALAGSVAQGVADDISDIDMLTCYEQTPTREEREAFREQAGGTDWIFFYGDPAEAGKNILGVLMGLNRRYHWGEYKRLERLAANLEIAPPELAARLNQILRGEPEEYARELHTLIGETFTLVERHLPHLDITKAVSRYRLTPEWERNRGEGKSPSFSLLREREREGERGIQNG